MATDFTPPRPLGRSWRWLVKSVNWIKPDQLGNVNIGLQDLDDTTGTPEDGDTYVYNSITNVFETGQGHVHYAEILKLAGQAPEATYDLTFIPVDQPHWPLAFCGGAPQVADRDYTIAERTLTVLAAMDLRAADELLVSYHYRYVLPDAPPPDEIPPGDPPPDPEEFPALALLQYEETSGNPRTFAGIVEGVFPGDEDNFWVQYIDVSHGHGASRSCAFTVLDADTGTVQLDNSRIQPWFGGEAPTGFKLYVNLSTDVFAAHYGVGVSSTLYDGDASVDAGVIVL